MLLPSSRAVIGTLVGICGAAIAEMGERRLRGCGELEGGGETTSFDHRQKGERGGTVVAYVALK